MNCDQGLLNLLQIHFPLVMEPFEELARELGITEEETIRRVMALKKRGIIRQISAIFDTRRLGYQSALVALRVATDHLDESAGMVTSHPGVSHCYARSHSYNLWFTLTLPPNHNLEEETERLASKAEAEKALFLPNLRVFKISVIFDMVEGRTSSGIDNNVKGKVKVEEARELSSTEIGAIRALQQDLPLVRRPFMATAEGVGIDEAEMLNLAKDFLRRGIMRRYGATLRHREAGFKANALACWVVPLSRVEELGQRIASFIEVSHCYQRPTYSDWPYNLLTMLHAPSKEECEAIASRISQKTGLDSYILLYSTKEYKKVRVKYFV